MATAKSRRKRRTPAHPAARFALAVVRGIAVAVLSLGYYVTSGLLLMFGVACVWNGIGPGRSPELDYPVAGVVMLVAGAAVFVFFPRLVKRLTGREVPSSPYGAFGAGGGDGGGGGGGGN